MFSFLFELFGIEVRLPPPSRARNGFRRKLSFSAQTKIQFVILSAILVDHIVLFSFAANTTMSVQCHVQGPPSFDVSSTVSPDFKNV